MAIGEPRANSPSVQSPCVRNCCLDDGEICMGCGRSLDEILRWGRATTDQREIILRDAATRRDLQKPR